MTATQFYRADDIVFEVAGDRAVLLDAVGKELITLNPVGTVVWQVLDEPRTVGDVVGVLRDRFPDVPETRLVADAERFLAELVDAHLAVSDAAG